jgi:hypothetical protein
MPAVIDLDGETLAAAVDAMNTKVESYLDPMFVIDYAEDKVYRVIYNEDGSKSLADNANGFFGPDTTPAEFVEAKITL